MSDGLAEWQLKRLEALEGEHLQRLAAAEIRRLRAAVSDAHAAGVREGLRLAEAEARKLGEYDPVAADVADSIRALPPTPPSAAPCPLPAPIAHGMGGYGTCVLNKGHSERCRTAWEPAPVSAATVEERIYPCDRCGKLRTKAEGGTTFTVCDACWATPPPSAAGTEKP